MATSYRSNDDAVQAAAFATELGWMAIAVGRRGVRSLTFGHKSARSAVRALAANVPTLPAGECLGDSDSDNSDISALADRLKSYAAGDRDDFGEIVLNLDGLTRFQQRVTRACRNVSWGETVSYAELAVRSGSPRAARAVGNVMATNRFPILVPCHRVIGTGGSLGGFSAPSGLTMKRRLLRLEDSLPGASR
jgi:methylated-DNA-[protein]-cysteine S-methyltransferase